MKKFLIIFFFGAFISQVEAQSPPKMSYQAVVRNASNELIKNSQIGMKVSIIKGSVDGPVLYEELHTTMSNINGLVSLEVGSGDNVVGDISTIEWNKGPFFIQTETDLDGGTNYTISATTQLLSVPYALHANTADRFLGEVNITETDPVFTNSVAAGITQEDIAHWNNHTVDTDTQIDSAGIAALGFVAGPHTELPAVSFRAINAVTDFITTTRQWIPVQYNKILHDDGGNYDASTSSFIVPVDGVYLFSASLMAYNLPSGTEVSLRLKVGDGGQRLAQHGVIRDASAIEDPETTVGGTVTMRLKAGTVVYVEAYVTQNAEFRGEIQDNDTYTYFSGHLVHR